jgi:GNAT superfamily N-acetyltransferase
VTFELRLATPGDGRAIAEIQKETWAATYTRWVRDVVAAYDVERGAENWARSATSESGRLMVAENDTGVLGFAFSGPARGDGVDGAGEVYAIYVKPDRHGQGIGRALMADALAWMAGLGQPECILWVAEPSTRSRAFYEYLGFRLDEGPGATAPWRGLMTVRYRRPLP